MIPLKTPASQTMGSFAAGVTPPHFLHSAGNVSGLNRSRLGGGFDRAPGTEPCHSPNIETFAVAIGVGHRILVRPCATATFCVPFTVYVITPPPIAPPIF